MEKYFYFRVELWDQDKKWERADEWIPAAIDLGVAEDIFDDDEKYGSERILALEIIVHEIQHEIARIKLARERTLDIIDTGKTGAIRKWFEERDIPISEVSLQRSTLDITFSSALPPV